MILVDTSVWIDHLHRSESRLVAELEAGAVVRHRMIVGELALGSLRDRATVLASLADLAEVIVATHDEVMRLVEDATLFGRGLSLVDAHLLASLKITPEAALWTRDRKLRAVAGDLGIDTVDA